MNSPSLSSRDNRRFYTLLTKASYLCLSHFAFLLHPGCYLIPQGHRHEAHSYHIFLLINMSLAPGRSAKELRCRDCPASFRRINDAERHLKQHPKGLDLDAEYVIYIADYTIFGSLLRCFRLFRCTYQGCYYRTIQRINLRDHKNRQWV